MGAWAILLLGVVCFACAATAFGLLTRRRWGYRMAVVMLVVNLTGDLVNFLSGNEPRAIIGVPIVTLILWYVATRNVRKYFFPPRDTIRLDVRPP
jgi:hypothetical protein